MEENNEMIEVKEAEISNLEDILNLNQQLFNYEYENFDKTLNCNWPPNNLKYFKEAIIKDDSLALVVFIEDKIIGYLIGSIEKAEVYRKIKQIAEIDDMFIIPEYRGKGIGVLLYKRFIKWAKKKGINRVRVVASAQNVKTINFYKKNKLKEYDLILESDI